MNSDPAILAFHDVSIEPGPPYETGLTNMNFELRGGDLMLLRLENEVDRLPLADAAQGLAPAIQGTILFGGEDWQSLSADRAAERRSKIGRVFLDEGWLNNLDMDQNIMLAQRHHTKRSEADIQQEALDYARRFALPGLPAGRPSGVRRLDLRKAACIRAFMGRPDLIILEQPTHDVYDGLIEPLTKVVHSACAQGAAVLWMSSDSAVWNNSEIRPTRRAKIASSQLHIINQED